MLSLDQSNDQSTLSPQQHDSVQVYPVTHISGNAVVHQGDRYYYNAAPVQDLTEKLILTLDFPERLYRYENIENNQSKTFEWILRPPDTQQQKWDSFIQWWAEPGGIYWVSGKPGSGKSTLMKYLYTTLKDEHSQPHAGSKMIFLSFWFWEAANNSLQRTLQGCLQSFLVQLLRHGSLGLSIAASIHHNSEYTWSVPRLTSAIRTALKLLQSQDIRIRIFLDGLDESTRDGEALVKFILETAEDFSNIKICVSSRPERLYEVRFAVCPKLRMQDLNRPDIEMIVKADLFMSSEYLDLDDHSNHDIQSLQTHLNDTLLSKAQGVILWVQLVIRDLLRGMRNLDTLQELQDCVEKLPDELDTLYTVMLQRNSTDSKKYRADAALYCRLVSQFRLNVAELCLLVNDDVRTAYSHLSSEDLPSLYKKLNCERAKVWISVRTGGLLEIGHENIRVEKRCARSRNQSFTEFLDRYRDQRIGFIHRTARTYLLESPAGKEFLNAVPMSEGELQHILFETKIVGKVIFEAIESVAPIGQHRLREAILDYHFNNNVDQKLCGHIERRREYLEGVLHKLNVKGFLWTETYPRSLSLDSWKWSEDLPFISRTKVLTELSWLRVGREDSDLILRYLSLPTKAMPEYASWLIPYVVSTCLVRGQTDGLSRQIIESVNLDHLILNEYGEAISVFHETLWTINRHIVAERRRVNRSSRNTLDIWERLSQAEPSTLARIVGPTMRSCNSLFFHQEGLREPTMYVVGYSNWLWTDMEDELGYPESFKNCINIACPQSVGGPMLIFDQTGPDWYPRIYALSETESLHLLKAFSMPLSPSYVQEHSIEVLCLGSGIKEFRLSRSSSNRDLLLPYLKNQLPSLHAGLLHLGKGEANILTFAAAEEQRLAVKLDDVVFRLWKAWFWGLEDLGLKQYRFRPWNLGEFWPHQAPPSSDEMSASESYSWHGEYYY